jgi:hypothetical protein
MTDGVLHKLVITGSAEVDPGPLSRILDLVAELEAEGLEVPPEIIDVLTHLQQPKESK